MYYKFVQRFLQRQHKIAHQYLQPIDLRTRIFLFSDHIEPGRFSPEICAAAQCEIFCLTIFWAFVKFVPGEYSLFCGRIQNDLRSTPDLKYLTVDNKFLTILIPPVFFV